MSQRGAVVFIVLLLALCVGCNRDAPESKGAVQSPSGGPFVRSDSHAAQADAADLNTRGATASKPKIDFEQTRYDFGEVEAGEKVEHVFRFKNTGEDVLKIDKVRSS